MRIKICGIRSRNDALTAAQLGADAVGVLVGQAHPSPDFVSAADARSILEVLPPFVSGVLVSHVSDPEQLSALIHDVRPAAVQIHSPMTVQAVTEVRQRHPGLTLLKAVHMNAEAPLEDVRRYAAIVDGVVADSCNPASGQVGGTGLTHDWSLTATVVKQSPIPLLLAGGLRPENVSAAIHQVRPWGVDVNSGVKTNDGRQCPERMAQFIAAVRGSGTSVA